MDVDWHRLLGAGMPLVAPWSTNIYLALDIYVLIENQVQSSLSSAYSSGHFQTYVDLLKALWL